MFHLSVSSEKISSVCKEKSKPSLAHPDAHGAAERHVLDAAASLQRSLRNSCPPGCISRFLTRSHVSVRTLSLKNAFARRTVQYIVPREAAPSSGNLFFHPRRDWNVRLVGAAGARPRFRDNFHAFTRSKSYFPNQSCITNHVSNRSGRVISLSDGAPHL